MTTLITFQVSQPQGSAYLTCSGKILDAEKNVFEYDWYATTVLWLLWLYYIQHWSLYHQLISLGKDVGDLLYLTSFWVYTLHLFTICFQGNEIIYHYVHFVWCCMFKNNKKNLKKKHRCQDLVNILTNILKRYGAIELNQTITGMKRRWSSVNSLLTLQRIGWNLQL